MSDDANEEIRELISHSPTLAFALGPWERAMVACFRFEVTVRQLAGKFYPAESVTTEIGNKNGKPGLLAMLMDRPKLAFSLKEKEFLPKCNRLRNKLIHCEPDAVRQLVQELLPAFEPPDKVVQMKFPNDSTGAEIHEVISTQKGAVPVSTTTSRSDGFMGWMLQASSDGTFDLARQVFRAGIRLMVAKALIPDG
jgi:hypothetical protein